LAQNSTFDLFYESLLIGKLVLTNGEWQFGYSPDFRAQDQISPLTEFPDVYKTYKSRELFPFFVHRIPSASQPEIQETITREKIDSTNEVALLKRFGEISISNPFRLRMG
jgi:HipA-like protein